MKTHLYGEPTTLRPGSVAHQPLDVYDLLFRGKCIHLLQLLFPPAFVGLVLGFLLTCGILLANLFGFRNVHFLVFLLGPLCG